MLHSQKSIPYAWKATLKPIHWSHMAFLAVWGFNGYLIFIFFCEFMPYHRWPFSFGWQYTFFRGVWHTCRKLNYAHTHIWILWNFRWITTKSSLWLEDRMSDGVRDLFHACTMGSDWNFGWSVWLLGWLLIFMSSVYLLLICIIVICCFFRQTLAHSIVNTRW